VRCLVIQTAYLGDVVLTVPLLMILRGSPRVSWLGALLSPPGPELVEGQGIVDEVIAYDKRGGDSGVRGLLRAVREVRRLRPDVALIPHRSFRSALLATLAGVPRRVGFDVSGGRALLTERLSYRTGEHEVERVAGLAVPAGVELPGGRLPFALHPPEGTESRVTAALVERGVRGDGGLIVVAPGSRWATKRWPPGAFARAADELAREIAATTVLVGSGADREVCASVQELMDSVAVDLSGGLPLGRLIALVKRAQLVLSNDSAVAHVAAATGTPVVAIFGPTVPAQGYAPYTDRARVVETELECRPCGPHGSDRCPRGDSVCMESLDASSVVAAALEVLREN
jgi:heptosyltransferase-2